MVCDAYLPCLCYTDVATCTDACSSPHSGICNAAYARAFFQLDMGRQALPSGELDALLQHSHEHERLLAAGGMARAPSMGMGKLESMELPDAVAAVVRPLMDVVLVTWLCNGGTCSYHGHGQAGVHGAARRRGCRGATPAEVGLCDVAMYWRAHAPSMGMGKLDSMELPDAVAAVVRPLVEVVLVTWLFNGGRMLPARAWASWSPWSCHSLRLLWCDFLRGFFWCCGHAFAGTCFQHCF